MALLDWLSSRRQPDPPRPVEEIVADLERREAPNLRRSRQVEQSLLALTAEAGLFDLKRRLEEIDGAR